MWREGLAERKAEFWLGRVVEELKARGESPLVFSTAKTPSGPIHIGFGRELVYCNVLSRMLEAEGYRSEWVFFVDDFDSLKAFPPGIPEEFSARR